MKNIIIVFALVFLSACSSDDSPKDYTAQNDQEILTYLSENNLTAEKSNSGLYYIIDNPGSGDTPTPNDRVKVAYKGYYTNGTVFDDNTEGASFFLQNVINGWIEGISYFKEGGTGKLLIPSHLAYGSSDYKEIPGGSVLIFDIELIYVNYKTENEEQIQAYLTDNNIITQQTETGLHYTINTIGDGEQPVITDNVTVTYKGYFLNGDVFDESTENVNFNLENLIKGFSEGITYLNEGGSATFFIPAHLAYGNTGSYNIPGGSVLIFDVELITIN
ncbi:FKBP-type peptidyl-prolyl cis-trans isomerase [uncultured Algibacter sp.]|uniref:FKBP-type peptidyl-prolyl cis-trans isomerase n=1 Tax=uncultured Algibacter sp. TaxID=298659 RepID=UPI0034574992